MICKLCLEDKKLIRQSHIIPDFMYSDVYNDKHQINCIVPHSQNSQYIRKRHSGEYESNILCQDCDNRKIGSLETYGKIVLFDTKSNKRLQPQYDINVTSQGIKYSLVKNVNYSKFKLFLLSILWRSSISNRDFFREVHLGPHEDKIREMIFKNEPGKHEEYPILMQTVSTKSKNLKKIIGAPLKLRNGSRTLYLFNMIGILFIYNISHHDIPKIVLDHSIRPSNEFTIIHLPQVMVDSWFKKFYGFKNITKQF